MKLFEMRMEEFLRDLASSKPAPGGGAVAGLTGALGAALASMVANLALENKKYEANWPEMKDVAAQASELIGKCLALMDDDARVFDGFMAALHLPKDTEAEKAARREAIQDATKKAISVPMETLSVCAAIGELALKAALRGNKGAITDAAIAADLACLTANAASWNVKINLKGLKDEAYAAQCRQAMEETLAKTALLRDQAKAATDEALA
ncbi:MULTISPECIES: cyclodeaminase/cyclohydrolase family protein [Jonquetella]|uniref:Methenyl tetrahydrofolate cyclohydrolase n=1 Tax=Jonquetella anthropi DSM 22815 TaxID=885272 RepID=H0UJH6_9BACT|nr:MULTISPECIES: cyclodeaminase/cyclohydrolase family protein [Jonquetella]EEX48826.1 putative methenyltetrahydrofolate cyclohydrolase [Jonquetella anthropi E3_33 E1]EHM12844.1 methenyl tetrahydrofolate cyclohydrolase [Jonquetella anthropi DSM 22815]ERL24089.1 putative methenyltetrahydrofolate cyclohydrolase [Jonquetella sp. BV3C21]